MNYIKQHLISRIIKLHVLLIVVFFIAGCDKGFKELNTNPNVYTDPVIGNLFTMSEIRTAGVGTADRNRVSIKYSAGTNQYMASLGTNWSGDKNFKNGQFGDLFETIYSIQLKELVQMLSITKDKPEMINYYAIGSILRVFVLQRATDIYGDVPYKEAGLGFKNGTFKPKYDKQSDIYPLMLSELQTAIGQLDASKPLFAGGVMKSNADMAKVDHAPGSTNAENRDAAELKRECFPESNQGKGPVKLSKTLIDFLVGYNDPRLPFYATLWDGNTLSMQAAKLATTTNPALQKGLANGYDATTIKSVIPAWNSSTLIDYSEPNTGTIASLSAPTVIQSYAEVKFLLAEATLRRWDASAAVTHYAAAVNASMKSTAIFPAAVLYPGGGPFSIQKAAIDNYLMAHPLNGTTFESQLQQLYTQFYLAHFMWYDNFEAFAAIRRTGYPVLTPPNYPGNFTGGKALLRLRYPVSEATLNKENYDAAIALQGPDLYTTPVWWDK